MCNIFWFEQRQEDLPEKNDWLSAGELSVLSRLVFLKRRSDWRLGRWTAKCAFALLHRIPRSKHLLAQIEIRASVSGSPEILVGGHLADAAVSISHSAGVALTAIVPIRMKLGCDLELIERHSDGFVEDYFTDEERILLAGARSQDRPLLTTLIWSAKESALKAMQLGLRADTRSVAVQLMDSHSTSWAPLKVTCAEGDILHGWWRQQDGAILTTVAGVAFDEPVLLRPYATESSSSSAAD